jgi:hypothetical protein
VVEVVVEHVEVSVQPLATGARPPFFRAASIFSLACPAPLSARWPRKPGSQKEANRAHAKLRSPGERANAQLKSWHILRKIRCCPGRAGQLAKAIHVLQVREAKTGRKRFTECDCSRSRVMTYQAPCHDLLAFSTAWISVAMSWTC